MGQPQKKSAFTRFAWFNLGYNFLVVLIGAFVRASGSGAGCGSHWPMCNGVVIPREPAIETIIEYTHRLTSGLALIFILLMIVFAWRSFPRGQQVRIAAGLSGFFMITEALFGAGLVLLGLVKDNDSVARALAIVFHLVNTFALLACITLTARWSSREKPLERQMTLPVWLILGLLLGLLGILFLGASGAITALGDTLFPAESVLAGIQQEMSSEAHFLERLRIIHPIIAAATGIYLYLLVAVLRRRYKDNQLQKATARLLGLFGLQIALGFINVILLAPVWMQLVHLLTADLIWVIFVGLTDLFFSGHISAQNFADRTVHHPVDPIGPD